jgi:GNAT superfamily N-acetyltransferase
MHWRVERGGELWERSKGDPNRRALRALVERGAVEAVIAYSGGEPAAWCSFGPRPSFARLARSRVLAREAPTGTWSVVCFYVPARWRRRGLGSRLLAAAADRAFALGAREVEGFPVEPRGGGTMPAAFAWTGVPALFEAAGFRPIERAPGLRPAWVRRHP